MSQRRRLYWAITGACQLRCRYCFYETGVNKRPPRHADTSDAQRIIPALARHFETVVFTGGEPLLHPKFWDLVSLTRRSGMAVAFLTDGLGLDTTCVERIRHSGVSRVYVSLDSLCPSTNDTLRAPGTSVTSPGSRIVENVETLARGRPDDLEIVVLQTVCRPSIGSVRPMIQFCRTLGLDLLVHPAGMPSSPPDLADIRVECCPADEAAELERAMIEWANGHRGRQKYTRVAMMFIRGVRPLGLACPMGTKCFFLDADGMLSPCFHRTDLAQGNVFETDLDKLLARGVPENLAEAPCASLGCACMME